MKPVFSLVIPLKDEEENIETLLSEIWEVMQQINQPWEVICVDDGSLDQTLNILKRLKKNYPPLRLLSFSKNYGQSSAFDAGFKAARGTYVITLDGDGQNDPRDIPKLIAAAEKADLVTGRRVKRRDSWS